jgi:hypothetical protein
MAQVQVIAALLGHPLPAPGKERAVRQPGRQRVAHPDHLGFQPQPGDNRTQDRKVPWPASTR